MDMTSRLNEISTHAISLVESIQSLEHLQADLELMESHSGPDYVGLAHIVELLTSDLKYHADKVLFFADK